MDHLLRWEFPEAALGLAVTLLHREIPAGMVVAECTGTPWERQQSRAVSRAVQAQLRLLIMALAVAVALALWA